MNAKSVLALVVVQQRQVLLVFPSMSLVLDVVHGDGGEEVWEVE